MKRYVVEHSFTAVEAVELSVEKGEIVVSLESEERDGWVMVYRAVATEDHPLRVEGTASSESGFVPASYLKECSTLLVGNNSDPMDSSAGIRSTLAGQSSVAKLRTEERLGHASPKTNTNSKEEKGNGCSVTKLSTSAERMVHSEQLRNVLSAAPSKNALEYAKLKRQREESRTYIAERFKEAIEGLHKCHEHAGTVADALQEMEKSVHKNHTQWRQLIDEEKGRLTDQLRAV